MVNRYLIIVLLGLAPIHAFGTTHEQFVLSIKGGVSLGSYEAGVNWVLIEEIKQFEKQNLGQLKVFTGASAGSINTVISAINYCQTESSSISDNLYRSTWDVGTDDLRQYRLDKGDIAENLKFYLTETSTADKTVEPKYEGGLFTRLALLPGARAIYNEIENSDKALRPDCDIDMGIAVTKIVPDFYEENNVRLTSQRYVFPINVSVRHNKIVFKNIRHDGFRIGRNYLLLPEKNGLVETHEVIKIALASSAFPLAFSPVNLDYCQRSDTPDTPTRRNCPAGYVFKNALFSDGGIFNNAPIGSAIDIFSRDKQCDPATGEVCAQSEVQFDNAVFGYIDPLKHRGYFSQTSSPEAVPIQDIPQDKYIAGFIDYFKLSADVMVSGISDELHDSVRRLSAIRQRRRQVDQGSDDPDSEAYPRLLTSTRFFPVVGDYLRHFGAFFDKEFRNFDYYIGIYDGVINAARFICKKNKTLSRVEFSPALSDCIGHYAGQLYLRLNIKESAANDLVYTLARREFLSDTESESWDWLVQTKTGGEDIYHLIYRSLDDTDCPQDDYCREPISVTTFNVFLENLRPRISLFEKQTRKMIQNPNDWAFPLIITGLEQIKAVESFKKQQYEEYGLAQKAELQKFGLRFLDLSNWAVRTYADKHKRDYWPSDTSMDDHGALHSLLPDELGGDVNLGGVYFAYSKDLAKGRGVAPWLVEARLTPFHSLNRDLYPGSNASFDLSLRYHTDSVVFSSVGFGPIVFRDWEKHDGFEQTSYGALINVGLLADKLRISAVYRDIDQGDDQVSLLLGISDFKGFLDWVF